MLIDGFALLMMSANRLKALPGQFVTPVHRPRAHKNRSLPGGDQPSFTLTQALLFASMFPTQSRIVVPPTRAVKAR